MAADSHCRDRPGRIIASPSAPRSAPLPRGCAHRDRCHGRLHEETPQSRRAWWDCGALSDLRFGAAVRPTARCLFGAVRRVGPPHRGLLTTRAAQGVRTWPSKPASASAGAERASSVTAASADPVSLAPVCAALRPRRTTTATIAPTVATINANPPSAFGHRRAGLPAAHAHLARGRARPPARSAAELAQLARRGLDLVRRCLKGSGDLRSDILLHGLCCLLDPRRRPLTRAVNRPGRVFTRALGCRPDLLRGLNGALARGRCGAGRPLPADERHVNLPRLAPSVRIPATDGNKSCRARGALPDITVSTRI